MIFLRLIAFTSCSHKKWSRIETRREHEVISGHYITITSHAQQQHTIIF